MASLAEDKFQQNFSPRAAYQKRKEEESFKILQKNIDTKAISSIISGHNGYYLDTKQSGRYKPLDTFRIDNKQCLLKGWLLSVSSKKNNSMKKKRWFMLFDNYLIYYPSEVDSLKSYSRPMAIIPTTNCSILPFFKDGESSSNVGVHGIRITHAGREEVRILAFNRYDLEEWIEGLRGAIGVATAAYKRGWGIDPIHRNLSKRAHDAATLWEVRGPGVVSAVAGVETTVAITPPKHILHRLDASCFEVTITSKKGYSYELIVREVNEGTYLYHLFPYLFVL